MIFTSYFAKIKKFPENVIPVAICAKVPDWYTGLRYRKLTPKYDALMKYKDDHPASVSAELQFLLDLCYDIKMDRVLTENPDWHVALICYEKPSDFCHRHLVAEWFRNYGVECKEWEE